ncbi:necrosis inducing protein-domain-containing protein [Diplogelasinospora grovesii]|uniref:Necrosis inducing protein-domain-containing protein n=1 Tax=Diplogelasinospora grovesii TaxID=303347 RepID=A0AAN6S1J3_9PEZI|nr:necrosis inducing protein-domain-containing protein [Diplogelasinospora grovesii]
MHALTAVALLSSVLSTTHATPVPATAEAFNATEIEQRDIRGSLPVNAMGIEHQFQPLMDFDRDGCYYTSAIDPNGNVNPGLGPVAKCPADDCRNKNRLENNNLYSRTRCNNGWCAIMYEYYFEKDQTVCGSYGVGHRHDWENVVVFVQNNQLRRVAPSCHGKYDHATNSFRADGNRAKVVYHQDGGGTHCIRMANAADDNVENYTGAWFLGRLVGWNGWPSVDLRNRVMNNWSGGVGPKLPDSKFADNLRKAAGNSVPGFDPTRDA